MKRAMTTLLAVLFTAALALALPRLTASREESAETLRIIRVWVVEKDAASAAWLRKRASAFEKAGLGRVYLRSASEQEAQDAQAGGQDTVPPDLMILPGRGTAAALRGYALFVRDDQAAVSTPAPTSALFYRPSPSPGPTASPAPFIGWGEVGTVLLPQELAKAAPNAIVSANPLQDFSDGKAKAALLTAGQAAGLSFGYRAYALPEGAGMLTVGGAALTDAGENFLSFLLSDASQAALAEHGLYSPRLTLYGADDPLRFLIEASLQGSE